MNRNDLEQLVLNKTVEAITVRSKFGDLAKKFEKMSADYSKVKEKASALQKQLANLQEVTKRIKVLEGLNCKMPSRNISKNLRRET